MSSHQLEAAKRCFLRVLAWPTQYTLSAVERMNALEGMALYCKERAEWAKMMEHCKESLTLLPEAKEDKNGLRRAEETF